MGGWNDSEGGGKKTAEVEKCVRGSERSVPRQPKRKSFKEKLKRKQFRFNLGGFSRRRPVRSIFGSTSFGRITVGRHRHLADTDIWLNDNWPTVIWPTDHSPNQSLDRKTSDRTVANALWIDIVIWPNASCPTQFFGELTIDLHSHLTNLPLTDSHLTDCCLTNWKLTRGEIFVMTEDTRL